MTRSMRPSFVSCCPLLAFLLSSFSLSAIAQNQPPKDPPATAGDVQKTNDKLDVLQQQVTTLKSDLASTDDSDFDLQLGIGSLVRNGDITDYANNSNVLSASSLGSATPQYLVGISMRAPFHNISLPNKSKCDAVDYLAVHPLPSNQAKDQDRLQKELDASRCPRWRRYPWAGFVSVKFAPNSTETLNGYVIGGSYAITHYLNALTGFALSPVNEPSHGLRRAASQYVVAQQKLGNLLNFDPAAMANNSRDAFDGFSLLDTNGKLIYTGTPIETHYRGGLIVGVSFSIAFSNFITKSTAPK